MSNLLTAHMQRNPLTWRDLFRKRRPPTAMELAVTALEECRRDQLEHSQQAEYHTAVSQMLKERDKRLVKDIERLSKPAHVVKEE